MYLIRRIIQSIKKNKYKYLLLFLFIILLNIFLFTSGKLYQYDVLKIENIYEKFGTNVTIAISPSYIVGNTIDENEVEVLAEEEQEQQLNYEDYEKFSKSKYVKSTSYEQRIYLTLGDLDILSPNLIFSYGKISYIKIIGNNELENSQEFQANNNELIQGKFPNRDNEILISSTFAEKNNIGLHDKIKINYNNNIFEFRVVGLYNTLSKDNSIYTTFDTSQALYPSNENVTAVYTLNSYKDVNLFERELHEQGLNEFYFVNNHQNIINEETEGYYDEISEINNMKSFIVILFFIIILVISSFILENKKNNLKISRMLGVSKSGLIIYYLVEILIVTIFSLIFVFIFILIIDKIFLSELFLTSEMYFYIIRNMFFTNIVVLFLINFETILFINSYNVDRILSERF